MMSFIFVSVVCIGTSCDFVTSTEPLDKPKCELAKKNFFDLPFKPAVTLAAAQCMPFKDKVTT